MVLRLSVPNVAEVITSMEILPAPLVALATVTNTYHGLAKVTQTQSARLVTPTLADLAK
jgi:hypothetical protein